MNEAGLDGAGESGPARTPASPILVLLGRPPPGQLTRVAGVPLVRARDPRCRHLLQLLRGGGIRLRRNERVGPVCGWNFLSFRAPPGRKEPIPAQWGVLAVCQPPPHPIASLSGSVSL